MPRVCQVWKDPKVPLVQMDLLDSLDLQGPMGLPETEEHLACQGPQAQLEQEDLRDLRESEEMQVYKGRKDPKDPLVCKVLLDPWVRGENEVRRVALVSRDHQD